MIDKKLAIARLIKAGINVKDGKISKREILAAYKALAEELTYDTLRESANEVGADGMGALDLYMERYHPNASGPEELLNALEGFKSDCEDYILPAIERLIAHLGGEADSCMAKASNVEDDLSTDQTP
jgi:Ca2+-binding EF-hand superfamily protein